jgi:hypothetical protein
MVEPLKGTEEDILCASILKINEVIDAINKLEQTRTTINITLNTQDVDCFEKQIEVLRKCGVKF